MRFSSGESCAFSPTMPIITTPATPLSTSRRTPAAMAAVSSDRSALNFVVTAGNTPRHSILLIRLLLVVDAPSGVHDRNGPHVQVRVHRLGAAFRTVARVLDAAERH